MIDVTDASELWAAVVGYEGWYEVSSFGRVRALARAIVGRWGTTYRKGCLLTPHKANGRYLKVTLHKDGKGSQRQVHRLVLEAFIGAPPAGFECDHIDSDIHNNVLNNLRWLSKEDNNNRRKSVRMTSELVAQLRSRASCGESVGTLADAFGVSEKHVYQIVGNTRWKEPTT